MCCNFNIRKIEKKTARCSKWHYLVVYSLQLIIMLSRHGSFKPNTLPNRFQIPPHIHTVCAKSPTDSLSSILKTVSNPYFWISKKVGRWSTWQGLLFPYPKLLESSTIHDLDFTGTALVLSH